MVGRTTTLTTASEHGVYAGETVAMMLPDRRWWLRVWHWLLRRPPPTQWRYFRVTEACGTLMVVEPEIES